MERITGSLLFVICGLTSASVQQAQTPVVRQMPVASSPTMQQTIDFINQVVSRRDGGGFNPLSLKLKDACTVDYLSAHSDGEEPIHLVLSLASDVSLVSAYQGTSFVGGSSDFHVVKAKISFVQLPQEGDGTAAIPLSDEVARGNGLTGYVKSISGASVTFVSDSGKTKGRLISFTINKKDFFDGSGGARNILRRISLHTYIKISLLDGGKHTVFSVDALQASTEQKGLFGEWSSAFGNDSDYRSYGENYFNFTTYSLGSEETTQRVAKALIHALVLRHQGQAEKPLPPLFQ